MLQIFLSERFSLLRNDIARFRVWSSVGNLKKKVMVIEFEYMSGYVQMNQQDAQLLTNNLYFSLFYSTCFGRTIGPSSGAPSSKLYHAFGTFVQASLAATWL